MSRQLYSRRPRWIAPRLFVLICAAPTLAFAGAAPTCQATLHNAAQPHVFTTANGAHSLSAQQASCAWPVHFRGVVTYYDPYQDGHPSLFVADSTGGIFVQTQRLPILALHPGSVVEVSGVTDPGGYAPIVIDAKVRVFGTSRVLPKPPRVTVAYMLTGIEDGQRVVVEGMVHSVQSAGMHVFLTLATNDGMITASTVKQDGANYASLIDSKILIPAVAAPLMNDERQLIGVRLLFPDFKTITVEEPASTDPFSLPLRPITSLLQYSPSEPLSHRVHVRGRVTLDWPGRRLCIQDKSEGLCVQSADQTILPVGDLVDLTGFPERENYHPTLANIQIRPSADKREVPLNGIRSEDAFRGDLNARLVQIEGRLIGTSQVQGNPALLLSSGQTVFPAILPTATENPNSTDYGDGSATTWDEGSTLRVTGVFTGVVDAQQISRGEGISRLESFQILLRTPGDVVVLNKPSWWTNRHALIVLGLVVVLTLVVLCWVVVLRLRVEEQTLLLRRSEEKFRHLAHHDPLTGLSVRTVLLELLELAIGTARINRTPFALLMMDVDNFKAVNDTWGHAAGDEVLRIVALRLQASMRRADTVARIGGDEFVALLPGVRGEEEIRRIAAQVVTDASAPVAICGREIPVSVSVGVITYPYGGEDSTSLLRNVDIAMYSAKALGRNCYQIYSLEMDEVTESAFDLHAWPDET